MLLSLQIWVYSVGVLDCWDWYCVVIHVVASVTYSYDDDGGGVKS